MFAEFEKVTANQLVLQLLMAGTGPAGAVNLNWTKRMTRCSRLS